MISGSNTMIPDSLRIGKDIALFRKILNQENTKKYQSYQKLKMLIITVNN